MASVAGALPAASRRGRRSSAQSAGRLLRAAPPSIHRWLRADVEASIEMQTKPAPALVADDDAQLQRSLQRWASMIRRRRAVVIARRHLIAWFAVALLAEIVLASLGDDRHGLWLLAPLALSLLDGAIALRRPVALARVAHMLDRCLDLHDLLATAVELPSEQAQATGLAALVARDAQTAAGASFARVHLGVDHRGREWASLAACVAVLAALALVPGVGGGHSVGEHAAKAKPESAAALARGHAQSAAAAAKARRARALRAAGSNLLARAPLAVRSSGSAHQSKGSGFSPYGHGGTTLSAKQLEREGITPAPSSSSTKQLGELAVGESGSGSGSSAANAPSTNSSGSGGKAANGGASSKSSASGSSSAAGGTLTPATSHSGSSASAVGATKQAGGSGGASSGSSPPGGSSAGTAAGSTALKSGLVPVLGGGTSGLPLQAGYAPSAAQHASGSEGVSQTPNGGGSGGRSGTANGSSTSASSGLTVIPPTFNSTPALDQGVLSSYFGSANQLTAGDW
jgi:hypothetical protein